MAEATVHIESKGACKECQERNAKKEVMDGNRKARVCDDCGEIIPVYPNMGGAGYEAATVHHTHLTTHENKILEVPIMRELCRECFIADYKVQFPDAKKIPV